MPSRTPSALRRLIPARLRRRLAGPAGQGGQALPLFLLMVFVIVGAVAIVTDVSWFWVSQQRMQRAADSASLAGAVYLPDNLSGAYDAARAAATLNGYTTGVNGVAVTPLQDDGNKRRLSVTITGPVDTMFARIFNAPQFNKTGTDSTQVAASVTSKAEFTLPVPMGSPQNYYGVGEYRGLVTTTTSADNDDNQRQSPSNAPSGTWTTPANAYGTGITNAAANNAAEQWNNFNFQTYVPNDPTLVVEGIQIRLQGVDLQGSGASPVCRLATALSWNGGTTWSTSQNTSNLSTSPINVDVGSTTVMTAWGGHAWTYADFSNVNFRIRLTWTNGPLTTSPCQSTRTVDVDDVDVQVYWHTVITTSTTAEQVLNVPDPVSGTPLASQGFWGAVITKGGQRGNGDKHSPADNGGTANPDYDAAGYDYTIIVGASGQVRIFDPTFCENGPNTTSGFYGAGDHWIGGSPNSVSTTFSLWDENSTPYNTLDDIAVTNSGALFTNKTQADYSGAMGTPPHGGLTDCGSDPYHNHWWTMATGLSAGRYRLNVTTNIASNMSSNAENGWSLWVSGGTKPQVYGAGRMVAYNNLAGGGPRQTFYLAQIDATSAGKTLEISLFDPGDVAGGATLRILSPTGGSYNYTTFSYSSDNGRASGSGTSVVVASGSTSYYNNSTLTILVDLPTSYGSGGLTPSGETAPGWWKIEYEVGAGNDTTTWEVALRGSPVHLVH